MVTPLGVLKDTPESYNPTNFEPDRPNGLGSYNQSQFP